MCFFSFLSLVKSLCRRREKSHAAGTLTAKMIVRTRIARAKQKEKTKKKRDVTSRPRTTRVVDEYISTIILYIAKVTAKRIRL